MGQNMGMVNANMMQAEPRQLKILGLGLPGLHANADARQLAPVVFENMMPGASPEASGDGQA